jgi:hypothetical protein
VARLSEFTPVAGWDQQLFPSYLIATATIRSGVPTGTPTASRPSSPLKKAACAALAAGWDYRASGVQLNRFCASGLEAVNMVLLLWFVTTLHGLVQRRGGAGADWSRLAVAAGTALSALFALTIATHIAVVLAADGLAEPTPAFEMMWQFHAATFALALPALGATFIGAALATHASGLTRPWQRLLGVVGGSLPILAGAGNLAIADGSPLVFAGVLGLAMWLVWLVATGLRLIRGQN